MSEPIYYICQVGVYLRKRPYTNRDNLIISADQRAQNKLIAYFYNCFVIPNKFLSPLFLYTLY